MPEPRRPLPPAAEAFLERWGLTLESNAGHIRGIHQLPGELAALLDEERERCAAYLEGRAKAAIAWKDCAPTGAGEHAAAMLEIYASRIRKGELE